MSDAPYLLRTDDQGVTTLALDRPQSRNSLSMGMLRALRGALAEIAKDATVRVVLLAGNGPAFCAGHDLKEMTAHRAERDKGAAGFAALFTQCSKLMQQILMLPKPVIA